MCKIVQITSSIRLSELSACMKIETFMVLLRYPAHTDSSLLTLAPRSSAAGLEAKIQWVSRKSSEVYDHAQSLCSTKANKNHVSFLGTAGTTRHKTKKQTMDCQVKDLQTGEWFNVEARPKLN